MNFKEWSKPKVLIGGIVFLLVLLMGCSASNKSFVTTQCRTFSGPVWIDIRNVSDNFSSAVCKGQLLGFRSPKQFTVTFHDDSCVGAHQTLVYPLKPNNCPSAADRNLKCSDTITVQQPANVAVDSGTCDYDVSGGALDPRIIIIGR